MSALRATGRARRWSSKDDAGRSPSLPGRGRGRPRPDHLASDRRQGLPLDDEPARVDLRCAAVMRIGAVLVADQHAVRTDDAVTSRPVKFDHPELSRHSRAQSDYLAMVRKLLQPLGSGGEVVRDPRLPALRRVVVLGDSPLQGTITCRRSSRKGTCVPDDALARESTRWTRTRRRSSSTPRAPPFPQGRDALSHYRPQRGDRAFRMAITRRYHPHVSAALPPVRLLRGNVDVDVTALDRSSRRCSTRTKVCACSSRSGRRSSTLRHALQRPA